MKLMELLITLRTLTSAGSEETQLELPQCFQFRCGICSIEVIKGSPHNQPYRGLTQEISKHLYVFSPNFSEVYQLIEEGANLEQSVYGTS